MSRFDSTDYYDSAVRVRGSSKRFSKSSKISFPEVKMHVTHRFLMFASCILALSNVLPVTGFRINMNSVDNYSINKFRIFSFPPLMKSSVDKLVDKTLQVSSNGKAVTATACAAVILFLNLLSSPAFAAVGEGCIKTYPSL